MLDPKEMKKGGFGSFAELDRERREQREKASQNGTSPANVPEPSTPAGNSEAAPDKPPTEVTP